MQEQETPRERLIKLQALQARDRKKLAQLLAKRNESMSLNLENEMSEVRARLMARRLGPEGLRHLNNLSRQGLL